MRLSNFLFEAGFLNCPSARAVSNYPLAISFGKAIFMVQKYRIFSLEPNGLDDRVCDHFDADFLVFANLIGRKHADKMGAGCSRRTAKDDWLDVIVFP
jgi:hypothetical protein